MARLNATLLALALGSFIYQSTQAEKYVLQLFLALAVVRTFLSARHGPYALPFAFGLALAHHPTAVFLSPLLWRVRKPLSSVPAALLASVLVLLPVSLKAVYPAIRASAASSDARLTAWGRPDSPARLARYLAVAQYGGRFGRSAGGFTSRLAPQLGAYPGEAGSLALACGIAGALVLARAVPGIALPLLALIPLQWLLAGSLALPSWLTPQHHILPLLLAALFASVLPAFLPCLFGPLLAFLLLVSSAGRIGPALAEGRHDLSFGTLDLNRAQLALAPPGSYLFAGTDSDLFPLRWLGTGLGMRADVAVLDSPFQTKVAGYREYLERAAPGLLPPVLPEYGPWDTLRAVLRRVPPGRGAVFSGYLEQFFPGELSFAGPLAVHALAPCPSLRDPRRRAAAFARLPSRAFLKPGADGAREYAVLGVVESALAVEFQRALAERDLARAGSLVARERRLFPGRPAGWLGTGALRTLSRDPWGARQAYETAIALDPGSVTGYAELALLLEALGDAQALRALVSSVRAGLGLGNDPALASADRALAGKDPRDGALALNAVLARRALSDARERLSSPDVTGLRPAFSLGVLASHLRPDWPEPRALLAEIRRQTGAPIP
jgi:hypothetical protein